MSKITALQAVVEAIEREQAAIIDRLNEAQETIRMSINRLHGDTATQTAHLYCEGCGGALTEDLGGLRFEGSYVWHDGRSIHLGLRQREMLALLARRLGKIVHREVIYAQVWGDSEVEIKILDVTVCHIRKKLAAAGFPFKIRTEFGTGFALHACAVGN